MLAIRNFLFLELDAIQQFNNKFEKALKKFNEIEVR
jgi:hypothetical protein